MPSTLIAAPLPSSPPSVDPAVVRAAAGLRTAASVPAAGNVTRTAKREVPMSPPAVPARSDWPELYDALAPLVTDVGSAADADSLVGSDPFQALIADIAIQRSRDGATPPGGGGRRALLRAIAEMAETHAVAADLACEQAAIDLPLDVPDPVVEPGNARGDPGDRSTAARAAATRPSLLIVPDVIRTCRDRLVQHTTAEDRTRIDIVATLFDHILSDERLATDVRNTLARLQLPVLRMALADQSFFESRTHPTRRLLDRLVASAAEHDVSHPGGRTARAALERVVHTVIRGSFEDAGEHARLLEQFERAIIDIATAASATPVAPVTNSEDRDVLVIKATIQISQLLAGIDVDRAVRVFLLDDWSRVLVEIACRPPGHGRDALLARAKRLCFDLAWTTAPKTTSGERARLAGLLPTMIAAIRDGLRVIDYPADDERRFFAEWTRVLAHAVRNGPSPSFRLDPIDAAGDGIDAFARHLREATFGPESVIGGQPATLTARPEVGLRTGRRRDAVDAARGRTVHRARTGRRFARRPRRLAEGRLVRPARPSRRVARAAVVGQSAPLVLPVHRRGQRAHAVVRSRGAAGVDPSWRPAAGAGGRRVDMTGPPGRDRKSHPAGSAR